MYEKRHHSKCYDKMEVYQKLHLDPFKPVANGMEISGISEGENRCKVLPNPPTVDSR